MHPAATAPPAKTRGRGRLEGLEGVEAGAPLVCRKRDAASAARACQGPWPPPRPGRRPRAAGVALGPSRCRRCRRGLQWCLQESHAWRRPHAACSWRAPEPCAVPLSRPGLAARALHTANTCSSCAPMLRHAAAPRRLRRGPHPVQRPARHVNAAENGREGGAAPSRFSLLATALSRFILAARLQHSTASHQHDARRAATYAQPSIPTIRHTRALPPGPDRRIAASVAPERPTRDTAIH